MIKNWLANIALAFAQLRYGWKNASWLYRFDLLVNAVLFGDPRETISSRMGKYIRAGNKGVVWLVCKLLSTIDPARGNHCIESIDDNAGSDELVTVEKMLLLAALVTGAWWLL